MKRYIVLMLALSASPAFAQQPNETATLSACQQILGNQVVQGAVRESGLATQLAEARAELAKLKQAAAPQKDEPAK